MRYRLRTLLIVLALGPPVLAGAWLLCSRMYPSEAIQILILTGLVSAVAVWRVRRSTY